MPMTVPGALPALLRDGVIAALDAVLWRRPAAVHLFNAVSTFTAHAMASESLAADRSSYVGPRMRPRLVSAG